MSKPAVSRRAWIIRGVVGLIITACLCTALGQLFDPVEVQKLFQELSPIHYAIGLGCWMLMYALRAVRFVCISPKTPYSVMLSISALHNFFLRIMPMRTGELSFAYLAKRSGSLGLGEGLLAVVMLRLLDATAVVVIFAMALVLDPRTFHGDRVSAIALSVAMALVGILVTLKLTLLFRLMVRALGWTMQRLGIADRPRVATLLGRLDHAVTGFANFPRGATLKAALVTVPVWMLTFGGFFAIMRGFSVHVGIAQTVLGSTGAVVSGFLPVGGIGTFGTQETGWAAGFTLVGLTSSQAAATAFGVSLITFSYAILLAPPGWLGLWAARRRRQGHELRAQPNTGPE